MFWVNDMEGEVTISNVSYKVKCKGYIYMFLNKEKEVLYIGKTYGIGITKRLKQHLQRGRSGKLADNRVEEVECIIYSEFESCSDCDLYEVYFINMFNPTWNSDCNTGDKLSVKLPNVKFKYYDEDLKFIELWNINISKKDIIKKQKEKELKEASLRLEQFYLNLIGE